MKTIESRKFQNDVSIELSGQALAALYELLRGFQSANDEESGKLLEATLTENPQLIYEGLLTTLLRMVFIMYAEARNLLATDEVYQSSYSLAGLYERLRQDEAQNPDTMDSRYGAWAHLISLFRLIYDGADYDSKKGKVVLPARRGHLFDPDIYLFLEGRETKDSLYQKSPKISDGVVFRVLRNLLVLNGERISYRTLDVEQIGSVYETMMGFEVGIAEGETIALKPTKTHGAPLPINLDEILSTKDKAKKLVEVSGLKLTDKVKKEFNECKTIEDLERVLDKRIDRRATPFRLSKGAMVLVPSEARRKSGSHYTPRDLTEPIVRVALEPILKNLGDKPTPEQILDLKICDPAMGSGAFLVEACRQLSEKLVESWAANKIKIPISADEDELLHARKLIAQKCLYGVDKNHMAVNLAKLSLWLVTLAKDHAFSFLDHNLKHGDSLVGLTNKQIIAFDYSDRTEGLPLFQYVKDQLTEALEARYEIINATDEQNYDALKLAEAEYLERLEPLRLVGNLALKCFFDGKNEKERSKNIEKHSLVISNYFAADDYVRLKQYCLDNTKVTDPRFVPFHWELEFPEVFESEAGGFNCIVGNPPFLGGSRISTVLGSSYFSWIVFHYVGCKHLCDLAAYFFRRSYDLLKKYGTFGLIATNTISQGDSREGGLFKILCDGGIIYGATRSFKWPGPASVVVSVIHIGKGISTEKLNLDHKTVNRISAYLVEGDYDSSPRKLVSTPYFSLGSKIYGQGFLFDDDDEECSPFSIKDDLILKYPELADRILPYLGGSEILSKPSQKFHRYVISVSDLQSEEELNRWPELKQIIETKVKPERMLLGDNSNNIPLKRKWWAYQAHRPELYRTLKNLKQVLACSQVNPQFGFAMMPTNYIFSHKVVLFAVENFAGFCLIQSRVHELWARFFSSTSLELMSYSPSDCFETFPFPEKYDQNQQLENAGREYYQYRSEIMVQRCEGLTKTYNHFHDPDDRTSEIIKLRELHEKMDRVVFDSYGWNDLELKYDFILDYEDEDTDIESNSRRKKPYRYKFVSEIHDEILARLLKLNKQKYEEEHNGGKKF